MKRFDAGGQVIGEARFLGLYTAAAYSAPVGEIPQVRSRVAAVMAAAGVVPKTMQPNPCNPFWMCTRVTSCSR